MKEKNINNLKKLKKNKKYIADLKIFVTFVRWRPHVC